MRKVKFRAWHKKDKKMREVTGINFLGKDVWLKYDKDKLIGANFFEIELMQDTGFKDRTGKEIYEGDLLEFEFEDELENFINVVIWEKGCFALRSEKEYDYVDYPLFEWINGRIIGNIYENPELLELTE